MNFEKVLATIILSIGILSLFHAGYSAREFNLMLKDLDLPKNSKPLPTDILIECLFGLFCSIIGSIPLVKPFNNIMMEAELGKYTVDGIFSAPSYISFNHRGSPKKTKN
ncbi:hypothetical protein BB559_003311 [Furculomyces boomerangus]|uniref:Membrane magnesium transporter n=2 Tax=Harpellales TaxID=61421 RepID=A0A2T9YM22_9FUNG|nr:hypothetical protein BB559_007246 [Furculomyces boomerangus]PVU93390.1 hypothetical protein BB559_003311 [Furculomyces boomerangus]PVZ97285.1 hypothetical protein BB558_006768 [Smittium angustum]PWA02703.1 hypothetical protein BB558_001158 [Smittium angustum]